MICYCVYGDKVKLDESEEEFKRWYSKYHLLRMMTDTAAYSLEPLRTDYVIINDALEDVMENCIYPLILCGSIMSSTHFTERKNCTMYQFVYTFYGKGRLRYEHHTYSLKPGTIFLIDCNRPHYFHADSPDGWGYEYIHFLGGNAAFLYEQATRNGYCYVGMEKSRTYRIFQKIKECSMDPTESYDLIAHGLLTELLISLVSPFGQGEAERIPGWQSKAEAFIIKNFNRDLTVEQLADRVHLSPGYFSHKFKESMGIPPIEYQYQLRITRARELLTTTDMPVQEVAYEVGFHNVQNFLAKFRSTVGMTPGQYRKDLRETDKKTDDGLI